MGGRGSSSGMNHSDLHFSNKEIDKLTDSAIEFIKSKIAFTGRSLKDVKANSGVK